MKAWEVPSLVCRIESFQFQQVRLKAAAGFGWINLGTEFQFQQVRLKAARRCTPSRPVYRFQFQQVRLKVLNDNNLRLEVAGFQFQQVRLKDIRLFCIGFRHRVSIPAGTIEGTNPQQALHVQGSFNSSRYD